MSRAICGLCDVTWFADHSVSTCWICGRRVKTMLSESEWKKSIVGPVAPVDTSAGSPTSD